MLGGGARLIAEDVDTLATFSPDGSQLAFLRGDPDARESAVIVATADGANQRKLAVRKIPLEFPLLGLSWSPDGKTIAATGSNVADLSGQVVLVDAASGTERVLPTPQWRQVAGVAWLADGSGLLVNAQETAGEASSQIFLVPYPSGEPRRLTNDLSSYAGLSVAPDGRSFVVDPQRTARHDLDAAVRPGREDQQHHYRGQCRRWFEWCVVDTRWADRLHDRGQRQS